MKAVFWISVALIAYTYLGYPLVLWIRSLFFPRPVNKGPYEPTVSIVMAVHNGEAQIQQKLQNLSAIDYPIDKVEIVVASDGSTDGTDHILAVAQRASLIRVVPVYCPARIGKAGALAKAIAAAQGEILFFTDVRQMIEPAALRALVANFADSSVGCVSGELILQTGNETGSGFSTYWRFEKLVRRLESACGSIVGATGAIYAARRSAVTPAPVRTLLDDVYIPVHVVHAGLRVIFEPEARAFDVVTSPKTEFRRKVRTLAGNYQLTQLAPWLLTDANPLRFAFVSHKLLRLAAPYLLITIAIASFSLRDTLIYAAALAAQVAFYVIAGLGTMFPAMRLCSGVRAFVILNTAALIAPFQFVAHRNDLNRLWGSEPTVAVRVEHGN